MTDAFGKIEACDNCDRLASQLRRADADYKNANAGRRRLEAALATAHALLKRWRYGHPGGDPPLFTETDACLKETP